MSKLKRITFRIAILLHSRLIEVRPFTMLSDKFALVILEPISNLSIYKKYRRFILQIKINQMKII